MIQIVEWHNWGGAIPPIAAGEGVQNSLTSNIL